MVHAKQWIIWRKTSTCNVVQHTCWRWAWWWRRHWWGRMWTYSRGTSWRWPRIRSPRGHCTHWIKDLYWRLTLWTKLSRWWHLCWYSIGRLRLIHWYWRWLRPWRMRLSCGYWSLRGSTVVWGLGRRWRWLIERWLGHGWRLGYLCLVSNRIVKLCLCWGNGGLIRRISHRGGRLSLLWLVILLLWLWRLLLLLLLLLRRDTITRLLLLLLLLVQ